MSVFGQYAAGMCCFKQNTNLGGCGHKTELLAHPVERLESNQPGGFLALR